MHYLQPINQPDRPTDRPTARPIQSNEFNTFICEWYLVKNWDENISTPRNNKKKKKTKQSDRQINYEREGKKKCWKGTGESASETQRQQREQTTKIKSEMKFDCSELWPFKMYINRFGLAVLIIIGCMMNSAYGKFFTLCICICVLFLFLSFFFEILSRQQTNTEIWRRKKN